MLFRTYQNINLTGLPSLFISLIITVKISPDMGSRTLTWLVTEVLGYNKHQERIPLEKLRAMVDRARCQNTQLTVNNANGLKNTKYRIPQVVQSVSYKQFCRKSNPLGKQIEKNKN